jgi:hypothetical protein
LSFFDDEDEEPPTTVRPAHTQRQPRPQPRRPQRAGSAMGGVGGPASIDHHAMLVRRRIAAAIGVVLLIVIVLLVNGCLKRGKQQALEGYNRDVNKIGQESQSQARPLFTTLSGAGSKSALDVEQQVDEQRRQAQELAERAKGLSVPGEMTAAQRNLLLALDLRVEGLAKVASLVREALGGQAQKATTKIAGDMEMFLSSDVIYSQRVVPLIGQALAAGGIGGQTTASSHFLSNLGWLTPSTAQSRITGKSASSGAAVAPGTHGHSLKGVSVGTNTLAPSPTLNHVSGGSNPTFTVMVENAGSNAETNVKVDVAVTSEGKTLYASHLIDKTEPGSTVNVDIPVNGVALGAASRVSINVEPVPGETETENNKGTYLVIFAK